MCMNTKIGNKNSKIQEEIDEEGDKLRDEATELVKLATDEQLKEMIFWWFQDGQGLADKLQDDLLNCVDDELVDEFIGKFNN